MFEMCPGEEMELKSNVSFVRGRFDFKFLGYLDWISSLELICAIV